MTYKQQPALSGVRLQQASWRSSPAAVQSTNPATTINNTGKMVLKYQK
jgi:hypothetical protein